jgi:dihydroxyacetone kinase-like predicted kinase
MKAALKKVKSGEVTFAIRDTSMDGLEIHKDDYIGIFEKHILVNGNDKIEIALKLIENMVDDESSIITIIYGQDIDKETSKEFKKTLEETYPDIDIDVREGGQPIYSFLIGVE